MTAQGWLQIALFLGVLTALAPLLGGYMARVYQNERVFLTPVLAPVERLTYRLLRVNPNRQQDWKAYGRTVVVFSLMFWLALYLILRTQGIHPFNPEGFNAGPVGPELQHDVVVRHQHELAVLRRRDDALLLLADGRPGRAELRLGRGRHGGAGGGDPRASRARGVTALGNFWQDLVRTLFYILLPLSADRRAGARLPGRGPDTRLRTCRSQTVQGFDQTLALGPAASQIAIKQLGTNGGGFFNVNSAMPFENPTQFSNFVELLFILLIPAALVITFGRMVGSRRQGWALYAAMARMLVIAIGVAYAAEQNGSPAQKAAGLELAAKDGTTGGNLEGKEQRFGIANSATWAAATTAASNGSVNSAHDSYTGSGRRHVSSPT